MKVFLVWTIPSNILTFQTILPFWFVSLVRNIYYYCLQLRVTKHLTKANDRPPQSISSIEIHVQLCENKLWLLTFINYNLFWNLLPLYRWLKNEQKPLNFKFQYACHQYTGALLLTIYITRKTYKTKRTFATAYNINGKYYW